MNLSKRLMTAVDMVTDGNAVLDVGCDHAYTSIELVRRKAPYAVASDVRPGPLMAAREHIEEAGLGEKITAVLADGVPKSIMELLPENMPATMVITGMGGMLIIKILTEAGQLLDRFSEMILSPQSDIYAVRGYLVNRGYTFIDEAEVLEDGKFYTLMKVQPGANQDIADTGSTKSGKPVTDTLQCEHPNAVCDVLNNKSVQNERLPVLNHVELMYGPCLLRKKDETLKAYLVKRKNVLTGIREKLIASGRSAEDVRVREVDEELRSIDEAEKYY